jgi:hypothetical protein
MEVLFQYEAIFPTWTSPGFRDNHRPITEALSSASATGLFQQVPRRERIGDGVRTRGFPLAGGRGRAGTGPKFHLDCPREAKTGPLRAPLPPNSKRPAQYDWAKSTRPMLLLPQWMHWPSVSSRWKGMLRMVTLVLSWMVCSQAPSPHQWHMAKPPSPL